MIGDNLERWFDKLVKNKMGSVALPLAGASVGFALIQSSRIVPTGQAEQVADLGLTTLNVSIYIFLCAIAVYTAIECWRHFKKKK